MLHQFHIFILSNLLLICVHMKAIFPDKGETIDSAGGNQMFIRFFLICWWEVFQKMTWDYNLRLLAWIWERHFFGGWSTIFFVHWTNWILVCSAKMESHKTHLEDGMPWLTSSISLAHILQRKVCFSFSQEKWMLNAWLCKTCCHDARGLRVVALLLLGCS